MSKKIAKKRRKNSTQIGFEQHNFHLATRRMNSYKRAGDLLDELKLKLRKAANHLTFESTTRIFEIEEALEAIVGML